MNKTKVPHIHRKKLDNILKHKIDKLQLDCNSNEIAINTIIDNVTNSLTESGAQLIPDSIYNLSTSLNASITNTTVEVANIYNLALFNSALLTFNSALGYDPSNNKTVLYESAGLLVNSGITIGNTYNNLANMMIDDSNKTASLSIKSLNKGGANKELDLLVNTFNANSTASHPTTGPVLTPSLIQTNTLIVDPTKNIGNVYTGTRVASLSSSFTFPSIFSSISTILSSSLPSGTYFLEGQVSVIFTTKSPSPIPSVPPTDLTPPTTIAGGKYNYYSISISNSSILNPDCLVSDNANTIDYHLQSEVDAKNNTGLSLYSNTMIKRVTNTVIVDSKKPCSYYLLISLSIDTANTGVNTGSLGLYATIDPNYSYFKATRIA